ncbi:unnamed protein product, partial [Hapterophycus canaliculatus]
MSSDLRISTHCSLGSFLGSYTMSAPLPVFWSENIDDKGRTYYCNHHTRETTWQ